MALLKFGLSIALGSGLGYTLFQFTAADESELKKHLPPYSAEPQNCFRRYRVSEKLMNEERPKTSYKDFMIQKSTEK